VGEDLRGDPGSGVGGLAFGGLYLGSQLGVRWSMHVAMSAPILIPGYVVLPYLPSRRAAATSPMVGGMLWGAVLMMSIVVWPTVSRRVSENDARRTVREKEYAAAEKHKDEKRAGNLES